MAVQQSEGIISFFFRGSKSFFGFVIQKWNWSLMMLVVIIFLAYLINVTLRQETTEGKINYALIETGKTLLGADNKIEEKTDEIFKNSPSLLQTYSSSSWFKPKLVALWEIIKAAFSILFSLYFLYCFLRLIIFVIKLVIGDSELGPAILLGSFILLLIMIITNLAFILVQTVDSGEVPDINLNSLFIPFKGVYYFGKTMIEYGLDPAYNLIEMDIPKYEGEYIPLEGGVGIQNATII